MSLKFKVIGLLVALALPLGASAADYISSKNPSESVTKSGIDTLYIANNQINIDSDLKNDLYAAGQNVVVNGNIVDDAFIVSNNVTVNGSVGDSLKAAGSTVNINGNIGSDLFFAGSTINISKNVTVKNDLIGAGGFVTIDGDVGNNIRFAGQTVEINGVVDGSVYVTADTIKIGENAIIRGTLNYRSAKEAEIASGAQVQDIQFDKIKSESKSSAKQFAGAFTSFNLLKLFAAIILGLLLVYIFPKTSNKFVRDGFGELGRNLLIGLVASIVMPTVLIILLASIFGYQVAAIVGSVYLALYLGAGAYAGILLGALIVKLFDKKDYKADWKAVIVGQVAIGIIMIIPLVGWIASLFIFMVALGSILKLSYGSVKKAQR